MDNKSQIPSGTFKITGDWTTRSKQLKEKYPQLTDSDLKCETGQENELISRLSTRLNKSREEVVSLLQKTPQKSS